MIGHKDKHGKFHPHNNRKSVISQANLNPKGMTKHHYKQVNNNKFSYYELIEEQKQKYKEAKENFK